MSRLLVYKLWARVYAVGGLIVGLGVLLYKYATPTDEQLIAKFSPEVRRHYEEGKARREQEQQELMAIVKKTSSLNDPVWMAGPIASPFERRLAAAAREAEDRSAAAADQKEEIARARAELAKISTKEGIIEETRKGWKWWG